MDTAVQAFDPTVVPLPNRAGLRLVESPDDADPGLLDEDSRTELARLRAAADEIRENSRAASTRAGYDYWVRRYESWHAEQLAKGLLRSPTPWPVDLKDFELFLTSFSLPPEDEDELAEWAPPASGTITNIVSAMKWHTEGANVHWETTPSFDRFLKGLRNQLNEASAPSRAEPLVVEQLAVVGACLLAPSAEALRDIFVVVCHGLGLGPSQTARLTRSQTAALADDDRLHPTLRQHLSDLLDQPLFAACRRDEPLIRTYKQQIRQILNRCGRDAGISDGKTSRRHSPEEAIGMVEWLYARPDPARLRDHAILAVGFAAALRRSEIARATVSWIEWRDNGFHYKVHRSKTNKTNHPEQIGVPQSPHLYTDPDRALRAWLSFLESQGRAEPHMPLFPTIDRHGNVSEKATSGDAIAEMIRKRVLESGVAANEEQAAAYAGHSLRRGFCTSAAERGLDALQIAGQTRHTNLNIVQEYVDRVRSLDPEHNAAAKVLA